MCCGCGCGSGKWMFKHEPSVAKRLARGIRGLKSKLLFYFTIVCRRIFCIYSLRSLFISFFPHSLPMEMSHCDNDTACLKFHLRRILLLNSRNLLETSSLVVLASRKSGPNDEWFHATRSLLVQI
jgi:hypothetical protein